MPTHNTGRYEVSTVAGENVRAFVPFPLPPAEPLKFDANAEQSHLSAVEALTRLDMAGAMVPSLHWFVYAFVRKEAVISSQIEGTQATLIDLLAYEARAESAGNDAVPLTADVEEVSSYLAALEYARGQLADPHGLPLSMRLLNETHRHLMRGVRGSDKMPGEVRRSQNWIGGRRPGTAAFVPPPPIHLPELLTEFERYMHSDAREAPLIQAALLHVQFETIHPYLDGNGRVGRLLVTLWLEHARLLRAPLLYLSLHFKRDRAEYYRRLGAVRTDGDWEGWIVYFLDGVRTIADEAVSAARELFALVSADRSRLIATDGISVWTLRLFEQLPSHPIVTVASVMMRLEVTKPTAGKVVDQLVRAGVLQETTGRQRDREFAYDRYLAILRADTDLA